jgi:hypothetical protein
MSDMSAAEQLELKLKLERTFSREIRHLFAKQAKRFRAILKEDPLGRFMAINSMSEWEKVLFKHYERVQKKFGHVNFDELPEDFDDEEYLLLLLFWRREQARKRSFLIAATDEKAKNMALRKADASFIDKPKPSNDEFSLIATANMRRFNKGRVGNIAITETQIAAEGAKFIEADYFFKKKLVPVDKEKEKVKKQWNTRRDNKVRKWHQEAEGQMKNYDVPFVVGGQSLRFPGDNALGATAENINNCRCISLYFGSDKQMRELARRGLLSPKR